MKIDDAMQLRVLIGEFYEQLAHQILGGKRVHHASKVYRDQLGLGFMPEKLTLPDIYIPEQKLGIEVKGSQKISRYKLYLSQLGGFQDLLRSSTRYHNIRFAFFSYNFRRILKETAEIDGIVDILLRTTNRMALVDFELVMSLVKIAQRMNVSYGSYGNYPSWTGGPLVELSHRFLLALQDDPDDVCALCDIEPKRLKVDATPMLNLQFLGKEMSFCSIVATLEAP